MIDFILQEIEKLILNLDSDANKMVIISLLLNFNNYKELLSLAKFGFQSRLNL